jgi:hypothetical protein
LSSIIGKTFSVIFMVSGSIRQNSTPMRVLSKLSGSRRVVSVDL